MTIEAGARLGPYEILAPIGAGGMGEVYRAKDTRLGRDVAVKVLPAHLSTSAELRQRFEREAKTISQLSHPHICTLYDVGHQDGHRLPRHGVPRGRDARGPPGKGPLPAEQAPRYGIEIADALDKAHRQRDRPPRPEARQRHADEVGREAARLRPGEGSTTPVTRPSLGARRCRPSCRRAQPLTERGTILGTFQYMAPEQLEGKEADARSRHLRVRRGALRDGDGPEGVRRARARPR